MQGYLGTVVCKFGGDPVIFMREEAIFVTAQKCQYHVPLALTLSTSWMPAYLGTIMCGHLPASAVEIIAK